MIQDKERIITDAMIEDYRIYLIEEEKSRATIEKYIRNIKKLMLYMSGQELTKSLVVSYKESLMESGKYKVSSVNSMLNDINQFLEYQGWYELRVKTYRVQRALFCPNDRYLSKEEYKRLLKEAKNKGKIRLYFLLETLAATGMRVSELQFLTVEAVKRGMVEIHCKGKMRRILLPSALQKELLLYVTKKGIKGGLVFQTSSGKAVNRSNVWKDMKELCKGARVNPGKVFPHNLRHLFAQCFYQVKKDLAKLADILGHASIETTRIYLISTGKEHKKELGKMEMVVPFDFYDESPAEIHCRNRKRLR